MTGMEHTIDRAAEVRDLIADALVWSSPSNHAPNIAALPPHRRDQWRIRADAVLKALASAGLLSPEPIEGELAESAVQEWVMIPADQVHDEWAVERPDPVDRQPRYDRFPTLDAALAERWGNDRAVHRVATGWEPVDPDDDVNCTDDEGGQ